MPTKDEWDNILSDDTAYDYMAGYSELELENETIELDYEME